MTTVELMDNLADFCALQLPTTARSSPPGSVKLKYMQAFRRHA